MQMNAALSGLIKFAQNVINALGKIFGWQMEINAKGLALDDESLDVDTSGLDDITDSADNATEATKKLKDQLQGFDKLNVLRTTQTNPKSNKSDSYSGSTGAGGVAGGDAIAALKKTKGLFESEIDNLFDLGRYMSDKLDEALESIDWKKVYSKARNFGKGLAEYLNGLITPDLFYTVGNTISRSLMTAFHFLDEFGKTFNFRNFGTSIGSGINGFLHGFDWSVIFSAAKRWGQGLAAMLENAIAVTDFWLIGETLANKLKAALTFLLEFAKELDFAQIGQSLADGINGYIENFPAEEFAETINLWVQGIYDLFVNMLSNIKWDKVRDKIVEFIKGLDFKTVAIVLSALTLLKGVSFTVAFGSALFKVISEQFIAGLAARLVGDTGTSTVLQSAIGNGLGQAASSASPATLGLAGTLGTIAAWMGSLAGFAVALKSFFGMWKNGWSIAGEIIKDVGIAIGVGILAVAGIITGPFALALGGVLAAVSALAIGIHDHWDEISKSCKEDWDSLVQSTKDTVKEMGEKWNAWKTDTGQKISDATKSAKEKFDWLKQNAPLAAEAIRSAWADKLKNVRDTSAEMWKNVSKTASDLWDGLKTKAGEIWEKIGKAIRDPIGTARDFVGKAIDKIKGFFNFKWSLPHIDLPHFKISGSFSLNPPSVPRLSVSWYKKAYENPMLFMKPTVMPNMKGFGDGNGGELVYGHANLMSDIRDATGGNELTSIGNRQLANDQRIISLLTAILGKEFGISSRDVFDAVRNEATDYTMRTGRGAFEC